MFLDKTADHYLTIEDAVGVGELMIKIINERYKNYIVKIDKVININSLVI